ncbi:hypothetical protein NPIL_559801 [Nephila pilipes]|uniref:Uncharacterized protein n=1 Tax=Nephila pilipes TaxID=299642 RepID=A0A8X6IQN5_NEPPI|nr:hypothetical protein NPIL_559801 [Nephila pilipes]
MKASPKCCLCEGEHPASYLMYPRNPINHPPKPKQSQQSENKWERPATTSTSRQDPQQTPAPELSAANFPPLPSRPKPNRSTQELPESTIEDPFTVLKDPECPNLYKTLRQFVHIAKNIPTKAGRMAANFKFIEEN